MTMQTETMGSLLDLLLERLPDADKKLAEISATLQANFGPFNKRGRPAVINLDDTPLNAVIKTLEYFMKWEDRAKAAERYIDKYKAWSKLAALGPDEMQVITDLREEWRNIVYNQELRKEFAENP